MGVSKVEYDNETLIDISNDTVTPETLAKGYTAHNSDGEPIVGTMTTEGGSSVEEIFWITCDLDQNTLSASNFSHTYDEIIQAALGGKMVKGKGRINGLDAELILFDLVSVGGYSGQLIFAVFFRTVIQGQIVCLYINLKLLPDNSIVHDIMIVNGTNM